MASGNDASQTVNGGRRLINPRLMFWIVFWGLALTVFLVLNHVNKSGQTISADEFWKSVADGRIVGQIKVMDDRIGGRREGLSTTRPLESFRVNYDWKSDPRFVDRLNAALKTHPGRFTYVFDETNNPWPTVLIVGFAIAASLLAQWLLARRKTEASATTDRNT